jgi:hypothetical protein
VRGKRQLDTALSLLFDKTAPEEAYDAEVRHLLVVKVPVPVVERD